MSDSGLEGRVAIVAGAGGGLGGGIRAALTLASAAVASDAGSFITGQTIKINGGWAMH